MLQDVLSQTPASTAIRHRRGLAAASGPVFTTGLRLATAPLLADIILRIRVFPEPVLAAIESKEEYSKMWKPRGPWRPV